MSSVNKVILLGNAGRDAEVKYLPSGKAVATVSIARAITLWLFPIDNAGVLDKRRSFCLGHCQTHRRG